VDKLKQHVVKGTLPPSLTASVRMSLPADQKKDSKDVADSFAQASRKALTHVIESRTAELTRLKAEATSFQATALADLNRFCDNADQSAKAYGAALSFSTATVSACLSEVLTDAFAEIAQRNEIDQQRATQAAARQKELDEAKNKLIADKDQSVRKVAEDAATAVINRHLNAQPPRGNGNRRGGNPNRNRQNTSTSNPSSASSLSTRDRSNSRTRDSRSRSRGNGRKRTGARSRGRGRGNTSTTPRRGNRNATAQSSGNQKPSNSQRSNPSSNRKRRGRARGRGSRIRN
jgi:hypothetical protein